MPSKQGERMARRAEVAGSQTTAVNNRRTQYLGTAVSSFAKLEVGEYKSEDFV